MKILDKAVALEKALLRRLSSRSDIARHPIEIYRAVLDDIEDASEPASRGARVFPYNRVAVVVATRGDHDRATARAVFAEPPDITTRVRARLRERGCHVDPSLAVTVKFADAATVDFPEYRLDLRQRPAAARGRAVAPTAPVTPAVAHELHLVVVAGAVLTAPTARARHSFRNDRVNIGRLTAVLDRQQRVLRQNQVAFAEADEIGQSVSRAHAHVRFDAASGDARVFDDGSTHGTRVVRDGRTIEVRRGSGRGIKLQDGDELLLGQARVAVEVRTTRRR